VPTKLASEERIQFLDEMARGRGRRSASVILRVAYRRVQRTIEEDEDFAAEVRAREGVFWEGLHDVARDLALQGDKEMLVFLLNRRAAQLRQLAEMEQRRLEFEKTQELRRYETDLRHKIAVAAIQARYGVEGESEGTVGGGLVGTPLEGKGHEQVVAAIKALDAILGPSAGT
jgi:hypothetical protein